MESSSDDSFAWTDVSKDSVDNRNNRNTQLMEAHCVGKFESATNYNQKAYDTNLESENDTEIRKKRKKKKRRKSSEIKQDSSDCSQPERKRIKIEPESDIDVTKKQNIETGQNVQGSLSQHSVLYNEDYLDMKVKQEQSSCIRTKRKKKHKRSICNTENTYEFDSVEELHGEHYLDVPVKQEQASLVEPEIIQSKKIEQQGRSIVSSDVDIARETKSMMVLSNPIQENSLEYSIIEEKFDAEETVVEKPRKRKHKTDALKTHNKHKDESIYAKNATITSEENNDHDNDMSLEPNDFTCNNVASSTIINSSAINFIEKQINKTEELQRGKNKLHKTKISDRIRFEEDDNLRQQGSLNDQTSVNMNMFLKSNPKIELYATTALDSIFTNDDEIWTFTWPREIDLEKLRDTTVSYEGKCKIKIDGQTYEGVLNDDLTPIPLLTQQHEQAIITNLPTNDHVNYYKRVPKVHIPNNNIMVNNQTNFTPLPETKCRHPLFGSRYKKAIKIGGHVAERLQAAKQRCDETPSEAIIKRKHKKYKHKSVDIKVEEDNVDLNPGTLKKKKKRQHSQGNDVPAKKLKRDKHIADSRAVWECEKAIEENLFNF